MSPRILLVEDEPGLVLTLSDLLSAEGYAIESVGDGEAALAKAGAEDFQLMILDLMLPKRTGFEVCRKLRQMGEDLAILMLTARSQIADRVVGLRIGADDHLTKPFDPEELLARVEALLRRVLKENRTPVRAFAFDDVAVNFECAEVLKGGRPVSLASKELQLLRYLVDNRDRVVPREEIMRKVWEYNSEVSSRTIDVHVAWLRQKLEQNPQRPRDIQTIRGKGYRFAG
jgi:two-component system, OmpR family, alkaline phosphatase synthesis response regulator PhoP